MEDHVSPFSWSSMRLDPPVKSALGVEPVSGGVRRLVDYCIVEQRLGEAGLAVDLDPVGPGGLLPRPRRTPHGGAGVGVEVVLPAEGDVRAGWVGGVETGDGRGDLLEAVRTRERRVLRHRARAAQAVPAGQDVPEVGLPASLSGSAFFSSS